MRALDTNVLVRYITNDEPKQAFQAGRLMEECEREREPLYISTPVLCELVWVLNSGARLTKAEIVAVLDELVQKPIFKIEHDIPVRRAIECFRAGKAGFTDYLLGEIAAESGCRDTVSFDKSLAGAAGFTIL